MKPFTIDKHISWMYSQILKAETSPELDICSQLLEHTYAYGYIMWLEDMHETEEPTCIGNSEGYK